MTKKFQPLEENDRGVRVKAMKARLICVGHMLDDSNIFDMHTWQAVRSFQRSRGLPDTGIFDEATDKVLPQAPKE